MDTITDCNDHQPARTNDHLICEWFSVANILPQLVGTPCQHCGVQDAVYWNHDDELGELLYCEDCMDEVYEPFVYEEIEPAPPELERVMNMAGGVISQNEHIPQRLPE